MIKATGLLRLTRLKSVDGWVYNVSKIWIRRRVLQPSTDGYLQGYRDALPTSLVEYVDIPVPRADTSPQGEAVAVVDNVHRSEPLHCNRRVSHCKELKPSLATVHVERELIYRWRQIKKESTTTKRRPSRGRPPSWKSTRRRCSSITNSLAHLVDSTYNP